MTHLLIKQYLTYPLIPPTTHPLSPHTHTTSPPLIQHNFQIGADYSKEYNVSPTLSYLLLTLLPTPSLLPFSTIFKLVLIIAKNTMPDNMKPITTVGTVQYPRQLIWKPIHIKVGSHPFTYSHPSLHIPISPDSLIYSISILVYVYLLHPLCTFSTLKLSTIDTH